MKQANTTQFTHVCTQLPSNDEVYALYGAAVAHHGDRMVVGAPRRLRTGNELGQLYVYDWNPTTSAYVEVACLLDPSGARDTHFGTSAVLDGDTLLVGASSADNGAGRVYVFRRVGATYALQCTLKASHPTPNAQFGWSVAVQGDRMAVGAYTSAEHGSYTGKVYVYRRTGDTWTEVGALVPPDGAANTYFGWSVAVQGDRMVVGACTARNDHDQKVHDQAGIAYVYDWCTSASMYVEVASLTPEIPEAYSWFGSAVALYGDTLLVGALRGYTGLTDGGKVYCYTLVDGEYAETGVLYAPENRGGASFGCSVALDGDTLLVGAKCANTFEHAAGKVCVYTR